MFVAAFVATGLAVYAIEEAGRANREAAKAKGEAARADGETKKAKAAEDQANDALLEGEFAEARALRLARQPGWRARSLDLLRQAVALRRRDRTGPAPADLRSVADLRGEAVMALSQRDVVPVREFPFNTMLASHISADGNRAFQLQVTGFGDVGFRSALVDLTTGKNLTIWPFKVNDPTSLAFQSAMCLNRDGTRLLVGPATNFQVREIPSAKVVATPAGRVTPFQGPTERSDRNSGLGTF